jgi:hypothetical protein
MSEDDTNEDLKEDVDKNICKSDSNLLDIDLLNLIKTKISNSDSTTREMACLTGTVEDLN